MNFKKRAFTAILTLCMALCLFPLGAAALEPAQQVSDLYRESEYYAYLCDVELTGDWRTDLVKVALSQVGYHEGDCLEDYAGYNADGWGNYIEYSSIYYGMNGQWCAMFVSWCARQAEIPRYVINNAVGAFCDGVGGQSAYGLHVHGYHKKNYQPVVGDLVFFSSTGWGTDHVGIVAALSDTGIYVVEGNSLNAVRIRYYDYDDEYIIRYGVFAGLVEESAQVDFDYSKIQFVYTDAEHGHMQDGDPYSFDKLFAMHDRIFALPVTGFEREGYTLQGYVAERESDGAWYCGDEVWLSEAELLELDLLPRIIADASVWRCDAHWQSAGDLCFYCVWADQNGNLSYDAALPALFRKDSSGWYNPYGDLFEGQWYYETVREACLAGLISEAARFRAEDAATRAEFASMLYGAAGRPELTENVAAFADVADDHWAREAILWARECGLVQGVGNNLFLPEGLMSRQEMVTMLYRWLGKGVELPYGTEFADADTVSDWAQRAMRWATSEALIKGMETENGLSLCPTGTTSRAQSVTVALRVLDRLDTDTEIPAEEETSVQETGVDTAEYWW